MRAARRAASRSPAAAPSARCSRVPAACVSGSNSATLTRAGGGAPALTAALTRAMTTSGGGIILLGSSATLLPSGVQTYYVGGTLSVPANQPAGDYSGTFTLTVNYL